MRAYLERIQGPQEWEGWTFRLEGTKLTTNHGVSIEIDEDDLDYIEDAGHVGQAMFEIVEQRLENCQLPTAKAVGL